MHEHTHTHTHTHTRTHTYQRMNQSNFKKLGGCGQRLRAPGLKSERQIRNSSYQPKNVISATDQTQVYICVGAKYLLLLSKVFDKVLWCTKWHRKVPWGSVSWPHWYNSKITWANIVNAVLDLGTKKYNSVTNIKSN